MRFEMRGMNALIAKLDRILKHSEVKKIVRKNTLELQREAAKNAPVDTGFLRRSIETEITDLKGRSYARADYAAYVELGTRYQAAQPFMGPAYHLQKTKFINDLRGLVK